MKLKTHALKVQFKQPYAAEMWSINVVYQCLKSCLFCASKMCHSSFPCPVLTVFGKMFPRTGHEKSHCIHGCMSMYVCVCVCVCV